MQDVFAMARTTVSTPLEQDPSTEMSFTNNFDRMTKASLVARNKRSNSELSIDGLALLASTVVAWWDQNGPHYHRRKMLELTEMSIVSMEDRWLEKYNQLKGFIRSAATLKKDILTAQIIRVANGWSININEVRWWVKK